MHLTCEDHTQRCPEMPGRVSTVVPASGSRSSLLTPRWWSELGSSGKAIEVASAAASQDHRYLMGRPRMDVSTPTLEAAASS